MAHLAVPFLEGLLKTANYSTRALVAEALYSITSVRYVWKTANEKARQDRELRESDEREKKWIAEHK